eukprot:512416-Hanusia_phi.AAC.1
MTPKLSHWSLSASNVSTPARPGPVAFAELGLSIAVSFCQVLLSLLRQFESLFRTSPIVPELPAPDLLIKSRFLFSSAPGRTAACRVPSPAAAGPG